MPRRYREIYPSTPLLESDRHNRQSAMALMTVNYFQAEAASMPEEVFVEHHVMLNIRDAPMQMQNTRNGKRHDYNINKNDIVVTPAGVRSGWRWFETSDVIVVTLDPLPVGRFAETELGILLTDQQLADQPRFSDPDICAAAIMLRDTLETNDLASAVMFESLARVFLVKLLQRYGDHLPEEIDASARFTTQHYRRVLNHIKANIAKTIHLEELASAVGMSSSHFSRQFKQTLGKSPMQYVMSYRVEQAAKMVADPQIPLIEVALSCGFADQAHFTRNFKQFMGVTPKSYRTQLVA